MSKNMVGMLITTSQNPKSSQQIVAFVQPMMPNPKPRGWNWKMFDILNWEFISYQNSWQLLSFHSTNRLIIAAKIFIQNV